MYNNFFFYLFFTICISLLLLQCQLDDPKVEILDSEVINLTSDVESQIADGQSLFILTAELLEKTDPNKDVTFTTSYGVFLDGDKPNTNQTTISSSGRIASTKLQVTTEARERIFINATLEGHSSEKEVETTLSYPEEVDPFPDDLVLRKNGGNVINVEVKATKSSGKVSNGIPVNFSFIDKDTNDLILNFRPTSSLEDEETSVQIKSVNDSIGNFQFRIAVPSNNTGDSIIRTLNLSVQ